MISAEAKYLNQPGASKSAEPHLSDDENGIAIKSRTGEQSSSPSSDTSGDLSNSTSQSPSSSSAASSPTPSSGECDDKDGDGKTVIKCSAVHTLERDMPDYDYTDSIKELRRLILDDIEKNPYLYGQTEIHKCRHDDWYLSRYLLRNKMQINDAYNMLRKSMRFNREHLIYDMKPTDFPAEFYQLGACFGYEPDRKGNKMLYLRVALHRKTPEIMAVFQGYIYHTIKKLDDEAQGKGISVVIDCTNAGIPNADMELLMFIITTLKNYFPKGLSYFLVHNLPWILKPCWHIARAFLSEEHQQLIKFSDSHTVYEYVDKENLPDFMGGTCKRDYRVHPENCIRMEEAAKLWGINHHIMRKVLQKFAPHLPEETVTRVEAYFDECDRREEQEKNLEAASN